MTSEASDNAGRAISKVLPSIGMEERNLIADHLKDVGKDDRRPQALTIPPELLPRLGIRVVADTGCSGMSWRENF